MHREWYKYCVLHNNSRQLLSSSSSRKDFSLSCFYIHAKRQRHSVPQCCTSELNGFCYSAYVRFCLGLSKHCLMLVGMIPTGQPLDKYQGLAKHTIPPHHTALKPQPPNGGGGGALQLASQPTHLSHTIVVLIFTVCVS